MRAIGLLLAAACSTEATPSPQPDAMLVDATIDVRSDGIAEASSDAETWDGPCQGSQTDPHNCGRCLHDCVGGTCEAGVCTSWTIFDAGASDLASDNAHVYWTSGTNPGSVASCARMGCSGVTTLVPNAPQPERIAIDSSRVYYTTFNASGSLGACGKMGCDGGPTILSSGHTNPSWLVVDSNSVFYNVNGTNIFECTLPSCGSGAGSITSTSLSRGLAQEFNLLHWTEGTAIWSCQKGNCDGTRKLIATGLTSLRAVAGYGGLVYAVQGGANGQIVWCPNAPGCVPKLVAQGLDDPHDMEVDWTGIYFITRGNNPATDGTLFFCHLGGCQGTPQVLMQNLPNVKAITLDDDAVFVATASGPILGIAKP